MEKKFNLRNIVEEQNTWDSSSSYSGELYMNDHKIIRFYQHPIEGGYYPNGDALNSELYEQFLSASVERGELEKFHNGISRLISRFEQNA